MLYSWSVAIVCLDGKEFGLVAMACLPFEASRALEGQRHDCFGVCRFLAAIMEEEQGVAESRAPGHRFASRLAPLMVLGSFGESRAVGSQQSLRILQPPPGRARGYGRLWYKMRTAPPPCSSWALRLGKGSPMPVACACWQT